MPTVYNSTLQEIMFKRKSIRKFKPTLVPNSLIITILNAVILAPSASNRQPWRFYIVSDEITKEKLRQSGAVQQAFVLDAPVCVVCCADMTAFSNKETETAIKELTESGAMDTSTLNSYWSWWNKISQGNDLQKLAYLDLGIAVEHAVLMATANGLGTCWMRRIDEEGIAQTLDLPSNLAVVALLAVGYPDEDPAPRPRKNLVNFIINPEKLDLSQES